MGSTARVMPMTPDEFLAWEAEQTERHDFVGGEVYAMAGAEDRHVTASLNVAMALRQHLAGTPCRTCMADMKVEAASRSAYFYPDVVVTCSNADRASPVIKREPKLIVEVLSPGTAAYDRGEKAVHYRHIESLEELAFIDIDARRADVYRKGRDGLWVLHPFEQGEGVVLMSVSLSIPAAALFAEIDDPAVVPATLVDAPFKVPPAA
jgi:Uma2 family endonuclease